MPPPIGDRKLRPTAHSPHGTHGGVEQSRAEARRLTAALKEEASAPRRNPADVEAFGVPFQNVIDSDVRVERRNHDRGPVEVDAFAVPFQIQPGLLPSAKS